MGGFLSGLGTLLGGFNVARRIDDEGFDFREADQARQFERDRIRELAGQQDEDRMIGQVGDVLVGQGPEMDLDAASSVIPEGTDDASRQRAVQIAMGQIQERKSRIQSGKDMAALVRKQLGGDQRLDEIEARGDEKQDAIRLKAKVDAEMPLTAEEQRRWDEYSKRTNVMERRGVGGVFGGGAGLSPEGLDAAAQAYATTGKMPTLGMGAAGTRQAIINRAAEMFPGVDIASNAAEYSAGAGALKRITANRTAVEAFEGAANRNAEILKRALQKIPDFGVRPLNQAARAIQMTFGDVEMAEFTTALQSVRNEYARIISNPNLVGVMSDTARREGEVLLNPNATVGQILGALEVLQAEAKNRRESFGAVESELMGSLGASSGENTPPALPPPSGGMEESLEGVDPEEIRAYLLAGQGGI